MILKRQSIFRNQYQCLNQGILLMYLSGRFPVRYSFSITEDIQFFIWKQIKQKQNKKSVTIYKIIILSTRTLKEAHSARSTAGPSLVWKWEKKGLSICKVHRWQSLVENSFWNQAELKHIHEVHLWIRFPKHCSRCHKLTAHLVHMKILTEISYTM